MKENSSHYNSWFQKTVTRRSFLKFLMTGAAALTFSKFLPRSVFAKAGPVQGRKKKGIKGKHDLVLASGEDPYKMTVEAVKAIGGMEQFVKTGDVVVIKPNIAWDRKPEHGSNTNPMVVAALVELCKKAGAARVNVFDHTCNSAKRCYEKSGIKEAAEAKGAMVYHVDDWNFVQAKFSYDSPMDGWPVFRDAIECDTFINVPVFKHHGLTRLTLSMKNLMGICGGMRGMMHQNIGKKLVDITDFISPDLTVIDGYRMLAKHGPQGGNIDDVIDMKKIIVSTDPTLADLYACKLADVDPNDVPYVKEAINRGFGLTDISKTSINELAV